MRSKDVNFLGTDWYSDLRRCRVVLPQTDKTGVSTVL